MALYFPNTGLPLRVFDVFPMCIVRPWLFRDHTHQKGYQIEKSTPEELLLQTTRDVLFFSLIIYEHREMLT